MSISVCQLVGNNIRFRMTFTNDAGDPTDPTTVTCIVGLEGAAGESLTVVKESTGVYHADWDTTDATAGTYWARTNGTGALIAAKEIRLKVRASKLTN